LADFDYFWRATLGKKTRRK